MVALVAAVVAFTLFAILVLAWAEQDYERRGTLGWRSAVAAWLLYLFHADTVATASFTDVARVGLAREIALVLGVLVGTTGLVLFMAAVVALVRRGGFDGLLSTRLVTDGAFGLSRHPQNLGWTLILLGFAIGSGSLIALLLVGLFAVFVHRYTQLEERHLLEHFGDAYARYRGEVPAYVRLPTQEPREEVT